MKVTASNRQSSRFTVARNTLASAVLLATASQAFAEVGNPRVNQVGYLPNGEKVATYVSDSTVGKAWSLYQNGSLVAEGTTVPVGQDPASGDHVHQLGFSDVTVEGDGYVLMIDGDFGRQLYRPLIRLAEILLPQPQRHRDRNPVHRRWQHQLRERCPLGSSGRPSESGRQPGRLRCSLLGGHL